MGLTPFSEIYTFFIVFLSDWLVFTFEKIDAKLSTENEPISIYCRVDM